jgi:hypothetical protein
MASTICAATFPRPDSINRSVLDLADADRAHLVLQLVGDATAPALDIDGAVPLANFDVEGVIIGDGRAWAEARWWLLPSASAETVRSATAGASSDGDQYVVLLKPQFGDFVELVATA